MSDEPGEASASLQPEKKDEGFEPEPAIQWLHKPPSRHGHTNVPLSTVGRTSSDTKASKSEDIDSELRQTASVPQCGTNDGSTHEIGGSDDASLDTGTYDLPKSFVSAVHHKYNDDTFLRYISQEEADVLVLPKNGPIRMTLSGSIMLPKQVSMSGCEICVAGEPTTITKMCQRVTEMDLTENNITEWGQVFAIVKCIPQLKVLNISKNHFNHDALPDLEGWTNPGLTHLILNNTGVSWECLVQILRVFPSLEELHLSKNGHETVDILSSATISISPPMINYPSLRRLFFYASKVAKFTEICYLGKFFRNLEFVVLSETSLLSFQDLNIDEIKECFSKLEVLGLNRTNLGSWEEIEMLRHFPSLVDVRVNGVPFLERQQSKFRRWHAIALLPNVTTLNGSAVTFTEREDAERAFVRLYMDAERKSPRYLELEAKWGRLEPLVEISLEPKKTVELYVTVEDADGSIISNKLMDIHLGHTIRELKKTMSNVVESPMSKFDMTYLDARGPDKLIYYERKVHSYRMKDGDELIITKK